MSNGGDIYKEGIWAWPVWNFMKWVTGVVILAFVLWVILCVNFRWWPFD